MAYQCGALNSAVFTCQRHLLILASGCLPRTCHLSNDGIDRILRFCWPTLGSGDLVTTVQFLTSKIVRAWGWESSCAMKPTQQPENLPPVSSLLHFFRANTPGDAFLEDILQAVTDSDDNFCRGLFLDDHRTLCLSVALRMWWPEYVFRHSPKRWCCDLHMVIASSQAILELIEPPLWSHTRFTKLAMGTCWCGTLRALVPHRRGIQRKQSTAPGDSAILCYLRTTLH